MLPRTEQQITIIDAPTTEMTREEAERCIHDIHQHMDIVRARIWELDQRRGWAALGYRSFYACVIDQFHSQKSQLYRERAAARIESIITSDGTVGLIPERVLRPLEKYADNPTVVLTLYSIAQRIAGDAPVTSVYTEETVHALEEALANGVFSDGDGEQSHVWARLADDAMARVRERLMTSRQYAREAIARQTGQNMMHTVFEGNGQIVEINNAFVILWMEWEYGSYRTQLPANLVANPVVGQRVRLKLYAEDTP